MAVAAPSCEPRSARIQASCSMVCMMALCSAEAEGSETTQTVGKGQFERLPRALDAAGTTLLGPTLRFVNWGAILHGVSLPWISAA